ncbi:MAG: hypothetical protein NTV81_01545 [Candidatus Komeilibacteria bacterium]|nr:hypothetical protein [Candidatus Komeilibacteria bacterium]
MEIKSLLQLGRGIWGNKRFSLAQIIILFGKVLGDLCRWERGSKQDQATHTEAELKKELGNIIFSTIRWCDDLGYNPEECIQAAIDCQKKFHDNSEEDLQK